MRKITLLLLIGFSFYGNAQIWRSSLYPLTWTPPENKNFYTDAFLQDYSYAGYRRGEQAPSIPNSKIFDVSKSPYNADRTGAIDATAAIQTAINDAQANGSGIVYLPAGTYQVNPGTKSSCLQINKSNIFIKGDGVGQTFIFNNTYQMKNKAIISVSGSSSSSWTSNPATKALLTADVMNPTKVIPVDNPSMFKVGDLIVVRNFINDSWITEHKETDWLGYGSNLMGLMYCRYVTDIDLTNKTVTIDVPVRYALKTRDGACAFKLSGMISEVGLSDFSIGNIQHPSKTGYGETDYSVAGTAGYDCDASYVIKYNTVVNAWIKNVETYKAASNTTGANILSNGILVQFSKNVTIDNCNIHHAQYGGGNGNGYAYRISANEVLISNSTSYFVRHGFVFSSMWCSGNVFHNCKDIKTGIQCGSTGSEKTSGWGSDHHMHFSQSNLIDQSYSENSAFVAFYRPYGSNPLHNLTSTHTAYWNTSSAGTNGYCIWTQQSRYGYAIGTSGASSNVYTKENSTGSAVKTDPVDIVQGQGTGSTLQPQSLYLDQLQKRLATGATISATGATTFCSGGNVVLTATAGSSYTWYNGSQIISGATAQTYTATTTGQYKVDVIISGVTSTTPVISVTVNPLPTAGITSPANSFCAGGSVLLTSSSGTAYKWFNGTTQVGTAATYSATAAGSYTVEVTNAAGCKATSAVKKITVDALPTATITSSANSFCAGGSVVLTASAGASYKWFNGTTQVGTAAAYTATAAGSYTVEVTNAAGCKNISAVKTITVDALPTATITSPANSFCAGGSVVLTASAGASYKWFNGTTQVGTAATYTATAAGSYTVEVTNAAGCKAISAVKTITVDALPTATISSLANSFCAGGSVVLTASAADSYKWFNGTTQVGTAATYTATVAGSYTLEVTNAAGCKNISAVKTITVDALPTAGITSPANSFCAGGSVVLTASAGASYKWFNGTTQVGTAATYTATAAGSYTVEVTNAAGCKAISAVKTITVDALPTATISSSANSFCAGSSVLLTSSTGTGYKWFNGTTQVGTAAAYTATAAGSYTVEVTNAAGCKAISAVKTITVDASAVWYADTDGDGKGDPYSTINACVQPQGYVSAAGDACPTDPDKTEPGICGCMIPESDCTNQPQTITFTPFNETQYAGDPDFVLMATSSSGLPLTYTSSNPSVAVIIGNAVHIVGTGTTTITVSQAGNNMYAPASVSQDLTIQPLATGTLSMLSSGAIELYPNPGSEIIYLDFKGNYDEVVIKIYNVQGKEVYEDIVGAVSNHSKEVLLTEVPAGIYFVEIYSKQGKLTQRLIKK